MPMDLFHLIIGLLLIAIAHFVIIVLQYYFEFYTRNKTFINDNKIDEKNNIRFYCNLNFYPCFQPIFCKKNGYIHIFTDEAYDTRGEDRPNNIERWKHSRL